MDAERAIEVLENHNKWRRGGEIPMQDPQDIGEAVDIAVAVMKARRLPMDEPLTGRDLVDLDNMLRRAYLHSPHLPRKLGHLVWQMHGELRELGVRNDWTIEPVTCDTSVAPCDTTGQG